MGILILIVFGIIVGWIAHQLVSSPVPGGLIMDCVIGLVGSVLGAWVARSLFHIHVSGQLSRPSTWISAILGAAALLVIARAIFGSFGGRRRRTPSALR
jgi:uncharacterized membrane protein YeaQ/YmgE (transglycosylase-associated protein family)